MAPRLPTLVLKLPLARPASSLRSLAVPHDPGAFRKGARQLWMPSIPGGASLSPPKTITTRRILPYSSRDIYALIADIDAYSAFLPYCTMSRVTHWTRPDPASGKSWPARADLTVGWGPFAESYTSRVYCVPGSVVEAVSGKAFTSIPTSMLSRHGRDSRLDDGAMGMASGIFESLVTRWTVLERPSTATGSKSLSAQAGTPASTEVALSVRFQFANPALGFAVGNVADDMAEKMVQAFEERARTLYGGR
ncbi:hypothetical protein GQ53DRAFT_753398 [Thozetella sp. PMI_491]|nr:hypothetical protein GQ53DRAFT_753398 [Thozetella sp. PMI_491]